MYFRPACTKKTLLRRLTARKLVCEGWKNNSAVKIFITKTLFLDHVWFLDHLYTHRGYQAGKELYGQKSVWNVPVFPNGTYTSRSNHSGLGKAGMLTFFRFPIIHFQTAGFFFFRNSNISTKSTEARRRRAFSQSLLLQGLDRQSTAMFSF